MIELILGGARSGKSQLAESIALAKSKQLYYLATAEGKDDEMIERIQQHQARRGDRWKLIEEPINLADVLMNAQDKEHCFLIDCLTLWVSNLLMLKDEVAFNNQKQQLLDCLDNFEGDIIFVSNEVGLGIIPMGAINRRFVDEAGWLNQAIAKKSDRVVFTVSGIPQVLKGEPLCLSG